MVVASSMISRALLACSAKDKVLAPLGWITSAPLSTGKLIGAGSLIAQSFNSLFIPAGATTFTTSFGQSSSDLPP
jgi:hypothetical protein